jgi:hypothetical protein
VTITTLSDLNVTTDLPIDDGFHIKVAGDLIDRVV